MFVSERVLARGEWKQVEFPPVYFKKEFPLPLAWQRLGYRCSLPEGEYGFAYEWSFVDRIIIGTAIKMAETDANMSLPAGVRYDVRKRYDGHGIAWYTWIDRKNSPNGCGDFVSTGDGYMEPRRKVRETDAIRSQYIGSDEPGRWMRYQITGCFLRDYLLTGSRHNYMITEGWPADAQIVHVERRSSCVVVIVHSLEFNEVSPRRIPDATISARHSVKE